MKRVGGLFDAIACADTLVSAAWRAARGKRDRVEVREYLERLDVETACLVQALRAGSFRFAAYRTFTIRDPKTRCIHAPPFRDRVVHHALVAIAGPVLERGALDQSFACRKGREQHAALRELQSWVCPESWFFKADVAKFYDSIDHGILREMLRRRFRERRLLSLFDALLNSYACQPNRGLPIGALTSQYLGNFYLDPFDHWVKQSRRCRRYLRYMDDMLFVGEPGILDPVRRDASAVLDGLGLRIKHGGTLGRCAHGIPFLGFVVYPNRTRLNRLGRRRLRRRLHGLERAWSHGRVTDQQLQARGEALFAHARFADDVGWRRMVTTFSCLGEAQGPDPRPAGRLVEQHGFELPLGVSQQEQAG